MTEPSTGPATEPAQGRGSFGPVTLVALATGILTAVAGAQEAVSIDSEGQTEAMVRAGVGQGEALTMPLVTSLALVALAAWGVLLVTRGRVRRSAAVLALLAALGALSAVVAAPASLRSTVADALAAIGATGEAAVTGWFAAAAVGAVGLTLSAGLAVWRVPSWPEMGRRYDAPADRASAPVEGEAATSLDLWKAMDEGRDPTQRPSRTDP